MFPSKHLKRQDGCTSERFVTTYSSHFKPFSELQPPRHTRVEAKPAPAFITPPQSNAETWPVFYKHLYRTTNSIYGAGVGAQEPGFSCATGLPPVTDKAANVWKQHEAKDEAQGKPDILYQEGVILLSPNVDTTYFPVALNSIITNKDVDYLENSANLKGLNPAVGMTNYTFSKPTAWQCTCCVKRLECPVRCCSEMKTIPQSSNVLFSHVQAPNYSAEPTREPQLTEYQASYAAEWAQPKSQQCAFHHRLPHQNLHPEL
ncbi:uncharacterized protein [Embiotoca jacksoni]|uniref:uncharacterized protein n=1 Tax=Embiotoca jacksoni TaxID=100190 RepID=UPI00370490B3